MAQRAAPIPLGSPLAIYFETSTLWGNAYRADDPVLQGLGRKARFVNTHLFTTGLVVAELAEKYRRELRQAQRTLETASHDFTRRGLTAPAITHAEPLDAVLGGLDARIEANLRGYRIDVLDNQVVDQARLLGMAVRKEPPFTEKGEKGFRDAVITLTILAHARATPDRAVLIVTNDDQVAKASRSLPESAGLRIEEVATLEKADEIINNRLNLAIRTIETERKARSHAVIDGHRAELEQFLAAQEFLASDFFGVLPGEVLERINAIRILGTEVIALGELPDRAPEGRVRVTLAVNTEMDVVVSPVLFPLSQKFRIGEPARVDVGAVFGPQKTIEKTVEVALQVDGAVMARGSWGTDTFADPQWDTATISSRSPFAALTQLFRASSAATET